MCEVGPPRFVNVPPFSGKASLETYLAILIGINNNLLLSYAKLKSRFPGIYYTFNYTVIELSISWTLDIVIIYIVQVATY